jgi:hypothetical protein
MKKVSILISDMKTIENDFYYLDQQRVVMQFGRMAENEFSCDSRLFRE